MRRAASSTRTQPTPQGFWASGSSSWHLRDASDDVLSEAIAHIERGIELAPENSTSARRPSAALVAADRLDEVIADATRLIGRFPDVPELHLHRASARIKLGRPVEGFQEFGQWAYKLPRLAAHPFQSYPQWRVEGQRVREIKGSEVPTTGDPPPFTPKRRLRLERRGRRRLLPVRPVRRRDSARRVQKSARSATRRWTRLLARIPGVTSVGGETDQIPEGATMAARCQRFRRPTWGSYRSGLGRICRRTKRRSRKWRAVFNWQPTTGNGISPSWSRLAREPQPAE